MSASLEQPDGLADAVAWDAGFAGATDVDRRVACRRTSILCLVIALALYGLSPMMTLWSLAGALQHEDIGSLRAALDWRAVRDGLKQDFGAGGLTMASAHPQDDDLPAFGESFADTLVSRAVDDAVTPEHLMAVLASSGGRAGRAAASAAGLTAMLARIESVRFTGPTGFEVAIRLSDMQQAAPVVIGLQIKKWQWKVTQVHVPGEMLNPDVHRT